MKYEYNTDTCQIIIMKKTRFIIRPVSLFKKNPFIQCINQTGGKLQLCRSIKWEKAKEKAMTYNSKNNMHTGNWP